MLGIGGVEHLRDQPPRPRLHRRPLAFGQLGGPGPGEGLVEARFGRILGDHPGDALLVIAEHRAGQGEAAPHRLAGDVERGVILLRIEREPGQVALVIRLGPERQIVGEAGEGLVPAGISGEQHHPLAVALAFYPFLQPALQYRPIDPVGGRKRLRRDSVEARQQGLRLPRPAVAGGEAQILDPVVMVANPERGRVGRALAQQPGIMIVQ